jgi:hypothetical protein
MANVGEEAERQDSHTLLVGNAKRCDCPENDDWLLKDETWQTIPLASKHSGQMEAYVTFDL